MAIFRGIGGAGDSTTDATVTAVTEQATNAANSATAAASSASSAATSATNAATSATNAATSATNAAASETAAAASETAAAASETAAAASETAAETAYDNFDDRYLGQKSSDPTVDNDGDALLTGALYFNTTDNNMYVYTGSAWVTVSNTASSSSAAASASAAATSETNAASSASAASTSATAAEAAKTAAVAAQAAAEAAETAAVAAQEAIDGLYLGAQTSDPSVDLNGDPVTAGDWYYNTTTAVTRIYDGSSWVNGSSAGSTEVVDDTSPQLGGALDTNGNPINFGDGDKATFGDSEDLWLYHDGTTSYLYDRGTGNLRIITNSTVSIDGVSGGEFMATFVSNGAVSLYYDNSNKFQTTATGVNVAGNIAVSGTVDGVDIAAGATNWDTAYEWGDHASAGYLTNSDTSTADMSFVVDEDNMASNSDTKVPTQQSVKAYVDNATAAALHYHDPVRVESPSALSADYDNGTDGVGATLTNNSTQSALSIDGVALSLDDRVLVYNQATAAHNGVYKVTTVGDESTNWVLTRTDDADSYNPSDPDSLGAGDSFYVQEGNTGAGESYVLTTTGAITFGTTGLTFSQFSATPQYTGGTNIDVTGQVISVTGTVPSATTATTATNATNVAVTQDITSATGHKIPFIDGSTTGNYGLKVNTDGPTYYPSTDGFTNRWIFFTDGTSSTNRLTFGTQSDTALFYDGTTNTMAMELRADANSFIITDNGTTRFTFDRTTGDLNLNSVSLNDGTPPVTTNKLYNVGGSLHFNGSAVSGGGGITTGKAIAMAMVFG